MNIIKRLIKIYITARDFELQMNIMDSMRSKKETYKIRATKEQVEVLRLFASYGSTVEDFERYFKPLPLETQDDASGD